MRNPIENFGDYNKAREALKAVNGCWETLYKNIGDTAVAKATPKLLLKGGWIGASITAGILGVTYGLYKWNCFLKDRRNKIENEPALKQEFADAIEAIKTEMETESGTDS